jgi:predicted nucleic-acid-binding Zn-ribbon protein
MLARMAPRSALVTVGATRHPLSCAVCQGRQFFRRQVKLNTTGMELMGLGWANQSATGITCAACGYLHLFVAPVELWEPASGYPAELREPGSGDAADTAEPETF